MQRVACACALVADVDLLLFDEPTSNLSPAGIEDFRALVGTLKDAGKTLVIAEHRLHLFAGIVDRVCLVEDGRIAEEMTGEALFALSDAERWARGLRHLDPPRPNLPAPPDTDAGLTVSDLRFSYRRGPQVLDIARLHFPVGAVTVVAGENGAGKSTLARTICGLENVRGPARFTLGGKALSERARQRRCGMVMQDVRRQLFSESVTHEVTLGLPAEDARRCDVADLLETLDLAAEGDRHPLSLSGGQAQRLVVAATVAANKDVVIFDEPTSGVDWRHLTSIAELLQRLAAEGRVVIVITHDPELIAACGDYQVTIPTLNPAKG